MNDSLMKTLSSAIHTAECSGNVSRAARRLLAAAQPHEAPNISGEEMPGYWVPREVIERLRFALEELDAS